MDIAEAFLQLPIEENQQQVVVAIVNYRIYVDDIIITVRYVSVPVLEQ